MQLSEPKLLFPDETKKLRTVAYFCAHHYEKIPFIGPCTVYQQYGNTCAAGYRPVTQAAGNPGPYPVIRNRQDSRLHLPEDFHPGHTGPNEGTAAGGFG